MVEPIIYQINYSLECFWFETFNEQLYIKICIYPQIQFNFFVELNAKTLNSGKNESILITKFLNSDIKLGRKLDAILKLKIIVMNWMDTVRVSISDHN